MPLAGASGTAGERFRVSAGDQAAREIGGIRQLSAGAQSGLHRARQQVSKKESSAALLLGLGKGQEAGDLHASGQRLRDNACSIQLIAHACL